LKGNALKVFIGGNLYRFLFFADRWLANKAKIRYLRKKITCTGYFILIKLSLYRCWFHVCLTFNEHLNINHMKESFPKTMHTFVCWQWSWMNNKQCLIELASKPYNHNWDNVLLIGLGVHYKRKYLLLANIFVFVYFFGHYSTKSIMLSIRLNVCMYKCTPLLQNKESGQNPVHYA
jgi:hypothetical protein